MVIITMNTEHFSWVVVGPDTDQAIHDLEEKFLQHIKSTTGMTTREWYKHVGATESITEYYGVTIYEDVENGDVFRDGEKI